MTFSILVNGFGLDLITVKLSSKDAYTSFAIQGWNFADAMCAALATSCFLESRRETPPGQAFIQHALEDTIMHLQQYLKNFLKTPCP